MRIFWHNGSLMIEPESKREGDLLAELAENLKLGRPSGMQNRIPCGDTPSGSEGLYGALITHHEAGPSGLTSERNDQQHVIAINKRP